MLTRRTHDGFWIGVMRFALRRVSNAGAWRFYCILRAAYGARPDLAGED